MLSVFSLSLSEDFVSNVARKKSRGFKGKSSCKPKLNGGIKIESKSYRNIGIR